MGEGAAFPGSGSAACTGGMGVLERAVSYKEKIERGLKPNIGLFVYPALMAAE